MAQEAAGSCCIRDIVCSSCWWCDCWNVHFSSAC
jgi:hypothetical protein